MSATGLGHQHGANFSFWETNMADVPSLEQALRQFCSRLGVVEDEGGLIFQNSRLVIKGGLVLQKTKLVPSATQSL